MTVCAPQVGYCGIMLSSQRQFMFAVPPYNFANLHLLFCSGPRHVLDVPSVTAPARFTRNSDKGALC